MQIVRKKLSATEITPATIRYNPDCDCVEQTWDGGATWTPTPGADPRFSPAFRAPALSGGSAQCDAAANMVAALQQMVAGDISADGQAMLATYLLGVALLFVPAAGWIADAFLLVAEGILLIDQATIEAAFTPTVYDDLICTFFNNIDADGQMSDAQLTAFLEDVFTDYDFTAYSVISGHSDSLGAVGWSNMGALGTETGDCDTCACPGCYEWTFAIDEQGFDVCSLATYSMGAWHQVCTGGAGSTATMNIGQGLGAVALPGVSHVEMDLSFDGAGNPTDWQIYGLASDTGTCGGDQVLLASGTTSASGTVGADISETDVYGFQLITSTASGCGSSDVLLTAFRVTSTNLCAIGLEPNC